MDKSIDTQVSTPVYSNVAPPSELPAADALAEGLHKALPIGLVRGLVALVGQADPAAEPDEALVALARELIGQDLLVLATGSAARGLTQAGLTSDAALEGAGTGLVEFCAHCDIGPVLTVGPDTAYGSVLGLCARLGTALGVQVAALPVVVAASRSAYAAALEAVFGPALPETGDADEASRRVTAKRLSLGFNDRFDGAVYS